jgi:hypothetical protein
MRSDFEQWLNAKREAAAISRTRPVHEAALTAAAKYMGVNREGSIALAAQKAGRPIAVR